jgi:hypothetical protein
MALTPQPLPTNARDGLGRLGLDQLFDSLWLGAESFVNSEKAFRNTQRLTLVGLALSSDEMAAEGKHNDEGIAHLDNALSQLANARAHLDAGIGQRIDITMRSDAFRGGLARGRDTFVDQLSKQDFHPDDFKQIVDIWDSKAGIVTSTGLSGLLNELEATTQRVRDLRSQPDRGRVSGSLPLWKLILVGAVCVGGLGAVISCFTWFGCTWVTAFLQWYAPSLGALVAGGC